MNLVYYYNKTNESSASQKKHKKEWTEAPVLSALDLIDFCQKWQLPVESIKGNIAHLLYQFFEDKSSDITFKQRKEIYNPSYRKICKAIPSFSEFKKYAIPCRSMALGMLLFKIHDFIKK